jgi:uncharacterized membrane protein HdeD (DUF308 family)
MKTQLFKNWWLILIKGIILIILSFVVFRHPVSALVGIALYIGIALLLTGIVLIITSITARKLMENWGWKLGEGVFDTLFGFILLTHPGVTAVVLPFIVGFWVLFYGIMLFVDSFGIKKAGLKGWWIQLITGILTVIIGYTITFNPVAGMLTITMFMGIAILLFGIYNVVLAFGLKKFHESVGNE